MIECPNCGKLLRDDFTYCRMCATRLDGSEVGDFSTDIMNVFKKGEDYLYLFSENGRQIVLKAGSMDELAEMVEDRQYPWEFREVISENDSSNSSGESDEEHFDFEREKELFEKSMEIEERFKYKPERHFEINHDKYR